MFKYFLKRVIIFIPTLFAISLITFIISINAPGDPVEEMLSGGSGGEDQRTDKRITEKIYRTQRHELGLDLPIFYLNLIPLSVPDTLYRIPGKFYRKSLKRIIRQYGNWEEISLYYQDLLELDRLSFALKKVEANAGDLTLIRQRINELLTCYEEDRINWLLRELDESYNVLLQDYMWQIEDSAENFTSNYASKIHSDLIELALLNNLARDHYKNIKTASTRWKCYIPTIHFYGLNNQYHKWISDFLRGDFGISYQDMRPVSSVLIDALKWTLLISFIVILITYLVSIPLGVWSAVEKGTSNDRIITTTLFIFYSLPNFWIATLLIMFFGGGDYLDWFPPYGLGDLSPDSPLLNRFIDRGYHLILPIICWTYPTFAFLSRQMRGGMLNVINQDYIRTARAKGVPEQIVIWKHAFKNALLPVITMFGNVLPFIVAGSVVLEFIFSIPGIGKLFYESIPARNFPVIFTIVMFTSILTLIGYLITDLLYAVIDPRITFSNKNKY